MRASRQRSEAKRLVGHGQDEPTRSLRCRSSCRETAIRSEDVRVQRTRGERVSDERSSLPGSRGRSCSWSACSAAVPGAGMGLRSRDSLRGHRRLSRRSDLPRDGAGPRSRFPSASPRPAGSRSRSPGSSRRSWRTRSSTLGVIGQDVPGGRLLPLAVPQHEVASCSREAGWSTRPASGSGSGPWPSTGRCWSS